MIDAATAANAAEIVTDAALDPQAIEVNVHHVAMVK
jgi:hypothetical protein